MSQRRQRNTLNIWPGYVDALATLLLVFVFVLTLFMVAQYYLTDVLTGRTAALAQLRVQVQELAETLSMEQSRSEQLKGALSASVSQRRGLETRLAQATKRAEEVQGKLAEAEKTVKADKNTIELKLSEIASLQQDIATLKEMRKKLEAKVGDLAGKLQQSQQALTAERDRSKALAQQLQQQAEQTHLAQKEIDKKDIRIQQLNAQIDENRKALEQEKQLTSTARSQVDELNRQVAALRDQLSRLSKALNLSQEKVSSQKEKIEDLGRKLNMALVNKVEELNRYRSEFFGRLREVLGNNPNIRVVGDRFVFQSELFFATASADLGPAGKDKLAKVADTLKQITKEIPSDIDWVLEVEGHTDVRPIHTDQFPSNWELSTARANSIVHYLIDHGIPPERLAAAGFAQFQPLDNRHTPEAYAKNRRIELKFTSR